MGHSSAGTIPLLVADVFHLAGAFRRLGERIAGTAGQTQARWQALSVASGGPRTVAQMARRLGYARQSVQRTVDQLARDGLVHYIPNPDHKASPLVELTAAGTDTLARLTKAAAKWHNKIAAGVDPEGLAVALQTIRNLRDAVEDRV